MISVIMKVYVFGNIDVSIDNNAILAVKELENKIPDVSFVFVRPNEDAPFVDEKRVVILDTVAGIKQVELIEGDDINRLILPSRGSVHDFDLGFQLKYLKKLGKLGEVFIIGLPQDEEVDYLRIQSILRKLVAQDMQGS